jgi:Fe-S-cluster containining protein
MKRRSAPLTPSAAIEAVKTIYRELAERPIERNCLQRTECCRFRLTGRTPFLTKGEALTAAKAVRASGRKQLPESIDGACPLLNQATSRCLIYEGRPFGCRTHFCAAAGGPYARQEVIDLIHRLEDIDRSLGGEGSMALPTAVERAMREV